MRLPRPRFSLAQFLLLIALIGILLGTGVTLARYSRQQRYFWVTAVAFSPDGRTLAAAVNRPGDPGSVLLWDLDGSRRRGLLTGTRDEIHTLGFTPDSATLVSGSGGGQPAEILLWDVAGGRLRGRLKGHTGITSIAISPDGKTMATSNLDGTARLWDVVAARELSTLASSISRNPCNLAIAPDGRSFAWTDLLGNIAIRDIKTREQVIALKTDLTVLGLTFAPEGNLLAAVEGDFGNLGRIRLKLWNLSTESLVHTFDAGGYSNPVFSPDGRTLAAAVGEVVKVWDVQSGEEIHRFRAGSSTITSIAFAPDGDTLAVVVGGGGLKLWHLPTNTIETIRVADDQPFNWYALGAGFLAWTIAVASVRARRLSANSVLLGAAWAVPAVPLLIILATGLPTLHRSTSTTFKADCALLMLGLVLIPFRAEKVGLRGLFAGELLWAFKGLCIAAFSVFISMGHGNFMVPLVLNLLTVFAVFSVLRIRTDRARGAPWQHWVGLGVAIVEPMVLVALYAFPQAY